MKRALISVSDKTNLVDFAKQLKELNYEIISTGGTMKYLQDAGLEVIAVESVTNFPEILDGRVKTLHPNIHGGLLARRDVETHREQVQANNIEFIDLVVVNLYPFSETIAKADCTLEQAIENIDIGGPSMLRSAAKNYQDVTVVCDYNDYNLVVDKIKNNDLNADFNLILSAKAFRHSAKYDAIISNYLTAATNSEAESITLTYDLKSKLRYGENPHQDASFYVNNQTDLSLGNIKQLHGKELSYNNIQDVNAAINIVKEFDDLVVVALKHMNPCGVGIASDITEAYNKTYNSDSISIFGGIVATNREVTEEVALKMKETFLEIIIAPKFSEAAIKVLSTSKNIRLLELEIENKSSSKNIVSVNGGILIQDEDSSVLGEIECVTENKAYDFSDIEFGFKVCKHVKSNAIVIVKNGQTVGIGAGQMNRVGAAKIALESAKEKGCNSDLVLASDAFFPFDDVVELANEYGVTTIIQPGGSINDSKVIDKCNELGITMVFSHIRNFKH